MFAYTRIEPALPVLNQYNAVMMCYLGNFSGFQNLVYEPFILDGREKIKMFRSIRKNRVSCNAQINFPVQHLPPNPINLCTPFVIVVISYWRQTFPDSSGKSKNYHGNCLLCRFIRCDKMVKRMAKGKFLVQTTSLCQFLLFFLLFP